MAKAINSILNLKDNYSKTIAMATSNTTKFKNTVSAVTSTIGSLKDKTANTFGSMAKGAIALGAGYVGIKSAVSYVKEGIEMAKNSQLATAQLENVLKSTGGAAGMTKDQLLDLAGSYGSYTTYTKGAVLEGENLLLTFTGIGKDVLPDTVSAMLDMSTAMKQDVSNSAMTLGKALNDPVSGLTKLTKQGVTFTDEQKNQITAMAKAGDVAGAQKLMLAELNKEFGGSAKAAGETIPGKLQILQNTFNGLKKTVGEKFIPVLYDITKFATDHLPQIKSIFSNVFAVIGQVVNGAVDIFKNNLLPVFQDIWTHAEPYINDIRDLLPAAFEKVKEVAGTVFGNIKSFIDDNKDSIGNFVGAFIDLVKTIWDDVSPAITDLFTNVLPQLQSAFGGNNGVLKDILDNATSIFNFINKNWKEIKPVVLTIVGALGAYKLALLAIQANTILVTVLTSGWSFITGVIKAIAKATTIWEAAQWGLNAAMDANLVGVVIMAIAALGLAIYEVIKHWQDIYNWIQWVWGVISSNPILLFISAVLNPWATALIAIIANWDKITNAVQWAWDKLKEFWDWWNGTNFSDKTVNVNENINQQKKTQGASSDFGDTFNAAYDAGNNATGTNYWKGGRTWVGEHGKELVDLPSGAKVHTNNESNKIASGNGGHVVNINFYGCVGEEEFFDKAGQHVYNQVSLALLNS